MKTFVQLAAGLLLAAMISGPAMAAESPGPVRIGLVATLSTGGGYLGEDVRNGFMLAVEQGDGELGGVPVKVLVADDGRDPAKARQAVQRMIRAKHVDLMTGVIFGNVALATVPMVTHNGMIYISPNAADKKLLGKGCNKNFFSTGFEDDNPHDAMGKYLSEQGVDNVYLMAPNFPGGKLAIAGFKNTYKGNIAGVDYTKLGQSNYASALAKVRDADPDAVYFFYPGGMGVNFIKQYVQAGLLDEIPLYGSGFSFDNTLVDGIGDPALGILNTANWSKDLDNPANRQFVKAYEGKYDREPTMYAAHGYDTARLIGSALKAVHGKVDNTDAFRKALDAADFKSVRGDFAFASNHAPVQAFYVRKVVKDDDGNYTNEIVDKVFDHHTGTYPEQCSMQ